MNKYVPLNEPITYQSDPIEADIAQQRSKSPILLTTGNFFVVLLAGVLTLILIFIVPSQVDVQTKLKPCSDNLQLESHSGCNREEALCARRYDKVAYATMHNAFATGQDGFVFPQHRACMRSGLTHGIRAFMLDAYLITASDELKLCHTSCLLGSSSLSSTLLMFEEFLRLNPREIVTLIWEFKVQGQDKRSAQDIKSLKRLFVLAMRSAGLLPYLHWQHISYEPEWPTLDQMIAMNHRLVSFTDTIALLDEQWDMYTYDHAVETRFDMTSKAELDKSCVIHRGEVLWTSLFILNHFTVMSALSVDTTVTDSFGQFTGIDNLMRINQEPYMWNRISDCAQCLGKFPNFIAVDFWESSDVIQVVTKINSATFQRNESKCIQ